MARKYLFADESGNFDFRDHTAKPNGPTQYFAVGTAMIESEAEMQRMRRVMADLRHELAWNGVRHDGAFHASTDKQAVRDAVFTVMNAADFKDRRDHPREEQGKAAPVLVGRSLLPVCVVLPPQVPGAEVLPPRR